MIIYMVNTKTVLSGGEYMKFRKNNIWVMLSVVFGGIGILMSLISAVIFVDHYHFNKSTPEVSAVIEEIKTTTRRKSDGKRTTDHDVYVSYTVDGTEYYNELGYYSSGMHEGDTISVHYSPENPDKIKTNSYVGELIVFPMGVLFAGIGAAFCAVEIKRSKKRKFLIENGIRTLATVTEVLTDYSTTVNGKHPDMIKCEVVDEYTGQIHSYTSESSFNDCSVYKGMPVNIYVNPSNPEEAYVDIESLVENSLTGPTGY